MKDVAQRPGVGSALAFGFGTTTAMWTVGYFSRLPGLHIPSPAVFAAMAACLVAGGTLAGIFAPRPVRTAAWGGLCVGLLNLLILGSLLAGDSPNALRPSALAYIGGFIAGCAAVMAASAGIASRLSSNQPPLRNWTSLFARVAVSTTLLLIIVGGFVTSKEAGLAVVDWPNTSGYNMFLYPLSRMTGGVYYEHSHRLIASLVGLTVLVLVIHLWRTDSRRWLKRFALATLLAVIFQGVLGGLRVTGWFTWATDPADTAPNIILAIIHGVLGQAVFGAIVAMAVFTSNSWRSARRTIPHISASTDRPLAVILIAVLVVQLIIGAILRHIFGGLTLHVTLAVIALALAIAAGLRAWLLYEDVTLISVCGRCLVVLALIQLCLGIASLIVTGAATSSRQGVPAIEAITTTAHQGVGALLLAVAVIQMLWIWRLVRQMRFEVHSAQTPVAPQIETEG